MKNSNNYVNKNKRGASMLDYFILTLVSLFIGSAVIFLGMEVKQGINLGKDKVSNINRSLKGEKQQGEKVN